MGMGSRYIPVGQLIADTARGTFPVTLVSSQTITGAAVSNVDFTGLDIATDGYYMILINGKGSTAGTWMIYCDDGAGNLDTTNANYYSQNIAASGAVLTSSRANNPQCAYLHDALGGTNIIYIYLDGTSTFRWTSHTGEDTPASVRTLDWVGVKTATSTNITKIRLSGDAGAQMAVGSIISLYKFKTRLGV